MTNLTCLKYRTVVQNSRNLPDRVLPKIHGPLHVFHLRLQHLYEALLHWFHRPYNLPHALQETILHRKYNFDSDANFFYV